MQEEYRAPRACIGVSPDGTFDEEANARSIQGAIRRDPPPKPALKPGTTSAPKPPKLPPPKNTTARARKKFDELDVDSSGYGLAVIETIGYEDS